MAATYHESQRSSGRLCVFNAQELEVELPVVDVLLGSLDGALLGLDDDVLAGDEVHRQEAQTDHEQPHLPGIKEQDSTGLPC